MTRAYILVAEDDPALRDALQELLALGGYEALAVKNGAQALQAIRERVPDLVILDHLMPGVDGVTVLRTLRADPQHRDLPIILLTGGAHGIPPDAGATAIIEKPFKMTPLQDAVRTLLLSRPSR